MNLVQTKTVEVTNTTNGVPTTTRTTTTITTELASSVEDELKLFDEIHKKLKETVDTYKGYLSDASLGQMALGTMQMSLDKAFQKSLMDAQLRVTLADEQLKYTQIDGLVQSVQDNKHVKAAESLGNIIGLALNNDTPPPEKLYTGFFGEVKALTGNSYNDPTTTTTTA